MSFESQYATFY